MVMNDAYYVSEIDVTNDQKALVRVMHVDLITLNI